MLGGIDSKCGGFQKEGSNVWNCPVPTSPPSEDHAQGGTHPIAEPTSIGPHKLSFGCNLSNVSKGIHGLFREAL